MSLAHVSKLSKSSLSNRSVIGCWTVCTVIVLLISVLAAEARESADNEHPSEIEHTEIIWHSDRVCGLNCLYILLRSQHLDTDYVQLQSELLHSESLTSLTELKESGIRHKLWCELGKTDPEGLASVSKPAIAHLDNLSPQGRLKVVISLLSWKRHRGTSKSLMEPRGKFKQWHGEIFNAAGVGIFCI